MVKDRELGAMQRLRRACFLYTSAGMYIENPAYLYTSMQLHQRGPISDIAEPVMGGEISVSLVRCGGPTRSADPCARLSAYKMKTLGTAHGF